MNFHRVFIFLLLAGMIAGCGPDPRTVKINEKSNGQTVEMKVGEILQVGLSSDPINGYGWTVERIDPAYLESFNKDQYTPVGQDEVAGGTQVMSFKALKPGTTSLGLTYQKTAGGGVSLPKEFQIIVDIK